MDIEARRLAVALCAWHSPPYRLWASVRTYELAKAGEPSALVIWFNKQAFGADDFRRIGEPEYAVRRASGVVERSPHAEPPERPPLRLVYRRQG